MNRKVTELIGADMRKKIEEEVSGMTFTKNFRSATAEEWYIFLTHYEEPIIGGAAGKVIIHYDLQGNRDVFINTTVIFDDPELYSSELAPLVKSLVDELINRLVGFADTLIAVHAGGNSYQAEYIRGEE
ncbi:hypothetical protein [Texcoconibacillus texcoconensis]|uniref:Uncharacterized protein n=1 Tax=Texcoconibacillus texcoconensis TaxID=1095777 RepID=A0A840QRR7_9BACI|nr:hypothetical protein [Texcoconibacillus texcoconensis]MBB5174039.1 hypothetical protein [Texcoconibacillus texcoconensis]